jgi:hypothetical protein
VDAHSSHLESASDDADNTDTAVTTGAPKWSAKPATPLDVF